MIVLGKILYIGLFFVLPIGYLFFKLVSNPLEDDLVCIMNRYYRHKELERNSNKHKNENS